MTIRRLGPADASEFRSLRLFSLKESPKAFGSSYPEQSRQPLAFFEKRVEMTRCNWVFGCFDEGRLVGNLRLFREELMKERHKATIYGMYVAPRQRRQGVGRRLLERAIKQARRLKVRQLRLAVTTENRAAIALYQKAGFVEYGVEKNALRIGNRFYSETWMALEL